MRNEWVFISYYTVEKEIDQDLFLFAPIPDVFQMRNLSNWRGSCLDLLGQKEPKHWHNHVAQHHLKCSSFPRSLGWIDETEKISSMLWCIQQFPNTGAPGLFIGHTTVSAIITMAPTHSSLLFLKQHALWLPKDSWSSHLKVLVEAPYWKDIFFSYFLP